MQIKTFTIAQEQEANEFIKSHQMLNNGLFFHQGAIVLLYSDTDPGMTTRNAVGVLSDAIAEIQKELLIAESERRFWESESVKKLGGKDKQDQIQAQIRNAETRVNDAKTRLHLYRDLISEVQKGEFPL